MLTPKQLSNLPKTLLRLYSEVENDIIADMAKRLVRMDFIPSARWQFKKLEELGYTRDYILTRLSRALGIAKQELEKLMKEAADIALGTDSGIYQRAGLEPPPLSASPVMQSVLQSGLDNTIGLFENLTRTTAKTATRQFEHALDRAWLQITSGAFSHTEAVKMAIKGMASKGVAAITYPTGHTDYLDVAVRRATVTGVNQTALKLQEALADEMGCDLVETSAHEGARPSHAVWQGKIFSRSGTHPKYPDFRQSTGYGTGEGLGGWNCRHSFFPYFEGMEPVYPDSELAGMNEKKYEYNGKQLTQYEAEQEQRRIERNIRRWKREFKAMEAAELPSDEAAAKLNQWHRRMDDFLKQTGLKRQGSREDVFGFGRSEAAKSNSEAKLLEIIEQDAIIKKNSGNPKKRSLPDEDLKVTVDVDTPLVQGVVPKGTVLTNVYVMAGDGTSVPIRDLRRLVKVYGGKVSSWQKKSGDVYGENFKYVIHWYQNGDICPEEEFKLKGVRKIES